MVSERLRLLASAIGVKRAEVMGVRGAEGAS